MKVASNLARICSTLFEVADKHRRGKSFLEDYKTEVAAVGQGHHVTAKIPARSGNRRRLALRGIRQARLMVRSHAHLIAPVNQGIHLLRRGSDSILRGFVVIKGLGNQIFHASEDGVKSFYILV